MFSNIDISHEHTLKEREPNTEAHTMIPLNKVQKQEKLLSSVKGPDTSYQLERRWGEVITMKRYEY